MTHKRTRPRYRITYSMTVGTPLRYGENPNNPASIHQLLPKSKDPLSPFKFRQIEGKEQGFINVLDLMRAVETIARIAAGHKKNFGKALRLIVVILKHGNPCGAAVIELRGEVSDEDLLKAKKQVLEAALSGDSTAAFGGVAITNFELGGEARLLREEEGRPGNVRGYDVIISPHFTSEAIAALLRPKGGCIMLENKALLNLNERSPWQGERRVQVRDACLVEKVVLDIPIFTSEPDEHLRIRGDHTRIEGRVGDLILAWAVGSTSASNSHTLVKNGAVVVNACGQQSRIGSVELASDMLRRRNRPLETGFVSYSDGYYPFPDGPDLLHRIGVDIALYPRGSIKDDEIGQALQDRMTLVTLPPGSRGFYGHS